MYIEYELWLNLDCGPIVELRSLKYASRCKAGSVSAIWQQRARNKPLSLTYAEFDPVFNLHSILIKLRKMVGRFHI